MPNLTQKKTIKKFWTVTLQVHKFPKCCLKYVLLFGTRLYNTPSFKNALNMYTTLNQGGGENGKSK